MNSHSLQIASWAASVEHRKPFYLAVIDGDSRLGFVNSHFFLQFQRADLPAEHAHLRCLIDQRDRSRFDDALSACLGEEQEIFVDLRMRGNSEQWVKWELRFLEAVGNGPGRLFCMGYALLDEEAGQAAAENAKASHITDSPGIREWQKRLARQKEMMYKKVRGATVHAEHQERARIGHELHDNVNQILSSAQLFLGCLTRDNADFETIKTKTAEIIAMAIDEIRCLSHNIVPPHLHEKGLIENIEQLVDDLRYARKLPVSFTWSDLLTIETQDDDLKLTVYRMIQEQIRNICKYSQAAKIQITLSAANQQLRLQISDDGVGFDPKTVRCGLGLSHIDQRAKLYKGKALFNSAPGKGCTMIVNIPLELRAIL
jgi:signal transduction histidine kinase